MRAWVWCTMEDLQDHVGVHARLDDLQSSLSLALYGGEGLGFTEFQVG